VPIADTVPDDLTSQPPIPVHPLGACLVTLALAVAVVAGLAARSAASAADSKPSPPPGSSLGTARGPLPDTTLARVGASREVTVRRFRQAWTEVHDPRHPDTPTPQSAQRFLDLMVDKEVLGERAMASKVPWPPRDSADLRLYRDQVLMKAVLDSALGETARRRALAGEPVLRRMDLGVAARETAMIQLQPRYDTVLAARMALAWKALPATPPESSMVAQLRLRSQMPKVSPDDTSKVIARSTVGDYYVRELLAQWRWLDPWARPRVETIEAIEEMVNNGLFEKRLRHDADERHLERRPDLAEMIARRHEYISVKQLVAREVYDQIHPDSAMRARWYRAHRARYRTPDRAQIGRWVLPDRASAGRLAATLLDDAKSESLLAQGRRGGANFFDQITAQDDSVLLKEAMRLGPGAMIGPDSVTGGWRVVKVLALDLARPMTYAEARNAVTADLTDSLGEAGLRALIARVRRDTPVHIHPRAIQLMMAAR
jgi:hypothetical protein